MGIAILSAGYLFPVVLRFAGQSSQAGIVSIAFVVAGSVILGVAVWLLIYVPLSIVADKLARTLAGRVKVSAVLCTLVLAGVAIGLHKQVSPKMLFLLIVSAVLGVGGALYSFFRAGIARDLATRRDDAS